jgi:mannan endo-1,4-beta-mannosidase
MKKYIIPMMLILFFIFPAVASAGSKTRAQVLSYLTSLPSQSKKKVLSGQRTGFLNAPPAGYYGLDMEGNDILADITTNSGGYVPAIVGADIAYHGWESSGAYNLQRLIDHWNAGGLVELDWLPANPGNGNVWEWPPNIPVIDIAEVYTSGSTIYKNFLDEMDHVAVAIKTLQDNGVVVLFRPFPEMNPDASVYPATFWWGGKDNTKFHNLWIYVHNYFTNTKGLNNIIWVYGTLHYWGDQRVIDYFPGSSYVDIVGLDYYSENNEGKVNWSSYYDKLRSLGKPFALTEFGQCPGYASWDECGEKDTRLLIQGIKENFPDAVYWMNFDDNWELGRQANLPQLFADPWVVNRTDNPSGAITVKNKNLSVPVGIMIR